MTATKEYAYAYEAGYRDGSTNYELEHCPACKNVADLQDALAENDKLRELCGELLDNLMSEICAKAWWCKDKDWHACNDNACGNYTFVILARELGVEL